MTTAVFNPELHDESARNAQLERIFEAHTVFLVGSLARAGVLGRDLPSPQKGFGSVRDIDVASGYGGNITLAPDEARPFPVDVAMNGLLRIKPGQTHSQVLFDNRRPDVSVDIPSEAFEPYRIVVGGIEVETLHPDTLLNIHYLRALRPKDLVSGIRFKRDLERLDYTPLPAVYFQPLDELRQMVCDDPKLKVQQKIERLQGVYAMVPASVRRYTTPGLRKVKRRFVPAERNQAS